MNERIQQLDKAAQEYAGRLVGNDEDSNYNEWFYVYKEKFAELIVRECAKAADSIAPPIVSDVIKEHFGVEE
jgi:hypothetical protein